MRAEETPEVAWGDPKKDWVNIVSFGADPLGKSDSTAALQAAIDSGAKTVYLPGGCHFFFNGPVRLRGAVSRIIGLEGRCKFGPEAEWILVDEDPKRSGNDSAVVVIERCSNQSGGQSLKIVHESRRTLVVSSWIGAHVVGRGNGKIFLDDFCGRLDLESGEQKAWCRQLNTEHSGTMLTNNGASLWILGMKTEKVGTIIHTKAGGFTDLMGCFVYSNQGWNNAIPAFLVEDASANLCGLNERNFNRQPCNFWFREASAGEVRNRKERSWVYYSR